MKKSKNASIVTSVLACLLAASGVTPQASGIKNTVDDHQTKMQVSTIPLDSLDGLEVQSIREDGVDAMKTKAEVGTYRGRRAVRIVNDDGLTSTGTPAGAQAIAIVNI